ncbi:glycosyltransferase family 61 protein [Thiomicrospira microaerophila]|uniref:glycosyltransferase family 61 protein n=1 Tax=Thiomicrospira microaerophila TaxID=406020 RepID=UPI00200CA553|nr:glycosyltransferase family 61 protein [Thiomicrospira microaerophila]UQB42413.1 glycosyltransferase family 61 protein [Thiomicrospira microaerophila]
MVNRALKLWLRRALPVRVANRLVFWRDRFRRRLAEWGLACCLAKSWRCDVLRRGWLGKRFKGLNCFKVVWLDEADSCKLAVLASAERHPVFGPAEVGKQGAVRQNLAAEVGLFRFERGLVHGRSSHVFLNQTAVIERMPEVAEGEYDYATGGLIINNAECALLDAYWAEAPLEFEQALFVGGNGAHNFYHWLVEVFTKFAYLEQVAPWVDKDVPLLLPQEVLHTANFLTCLRLLPFEWQQRVVYLPAGKMARVKVLFTISAPNNVLFNTAQPGLDLRFFYYRPASVLWLRDRVLAEALSQNWGLKPLARLFLARRRGSARGYNQTEVEACLVKHGFEPVFMEDFSLWQQAWLFYHAKWVVGASGAAWTNIVFANPDLQALSWLPKHLMDFSAFSSLAKYVGCDLRFLATEVDEPDYLHSSYRVNAAELEAWLDGLNLGADND